VLVALRQMRRRNARMPIARRRRRLSAKPSNTRNSASKSVSKKRRIASVRRLPRESDRRSCAVHRSRYRPPPVPSSALPCSETEEAMREEKGALALALSRPGPHSAAEKEEMRPSAREAAAEGTGTEMLLALTALTLAAVGVARPRAQHHRVGVSSRVRREKAARALTRQEALLLARPRCQALLAAGPEKPQWILRSQPLPPTNGSPAAVAVLKERATSPEA
jgi:hypothetical protein